MLSHKHFKTIYVEVMKIVRLVAFIILLVFSGISFGVAMRDHKTLDIDCIGAGCQVFFERHEMLAQRTINDCGSYCVDHQSVGSGFRKVRVTSNQYNMQSLSKWPVDQHGRECISLTDNTHERKNRGYDYYTKYTVVFSNRCNKTFTIKIETGSGSIGYVGVPAGGVGKYTCTDGLPVNRDCKGIISWSIGY